MQLAKPKPITLWAFQAILELVNGILLPELFWPIVRINCSTDQEKLLKFEAEGPKAENWKFLRSLEKFV